MNADFDLENFLKSPFSKDSFKGFLVELFGEKISFLAEKNIPYSQEALIINSLQIAQNIKLEGKELGIFIFHTKSVKAKITLHNELKKILKESTASAILAIFCENKKEEFRLSLITSGFDYEANKETFSDLKRGSFILGHSQIATARTALQRLLDKKEALNLESFKEAFSQEPIQNEFFDSYKKHFDFIIEKLEKANSNDCFKDYKGINHTSKAIKAFANKLLGRIVFLYFLQKKGWLGVSKDSEYGSGRQDFLKNIFEKACKQNENFYDKYLRPLFFESLNKQRSDDFSPLFESKIPFLNGGLFEDELKFNKDELEKDKAHFFISQVLDNAFFKELLEFFERYNFTLEESSPKEVEIAIDPEMLGKIFENLIDYNKQNGAFYTPRQIVHYMCQNALLLHFKNSFPHNENELKALIFKQESDNDFVRKNATTIKEKLLNLSILDPSLGSGAFPMGLLSEMISILESLDKTLDSKDKADLKRRIVSKCIYGIDIDADAIEIAKLRFWLSIAVDEQTPQPLPNLDFKFMQGNSLCDKICGREIMPNLNAPALKANTDLFGDYNAKELDKISLFDFTKADELKGLFNDYFSQNEVAKKARAKKDILSLMKEAFNARIKELDKHIANLKKSISIISLQSSTKSKQQKQKDLKDYEDYMNFKDELKALLEDYDKNDFHSDKVFLYHFFFADIMSRGGFDIVIGNPPYIQIQSMKPDIKENYKNAKFKSFASMGDIYQLFFEKCFNLLSQKGIVSLITSNKWMRAGYGSTTRKYFYDNANIFKLIDLGARVFATATVDTNIIFYGKLFENANERLIPAYTSLDSTAKTISAFESKEWVIMDENERSIYEKISKHKPLKDWDIKINYGVKTGFNEAFIIDEETKNRLIKEDKKSAELIKPILRGRDIKRYSYDFANLYLINTHNGVKEKNILPVDVGKYKAIKKHLDKYYPHLETRQDKGDTPYNLRNCAYLEEFDKEKIVYQEICSNASYSFDDTGSFVANTAYIMTSSNYNLKVLLGLLNSKFYWWFFTKNNISLGNSGIRMLAMFIEKLPIPKPDKKMQSDLVALVDKIIEGKKNKADTSEFEKQIDNLVYKLYNLTNDEIKIIEGK